MFALLRIAARPPALVNQSRRVVSRSFSTEIECERKPLSLFFWGTSNKGTMPTDTVLEEGRSAVNTRNPAGKMLSRGGKVIDHPVKIDLENAFGDENICIKDIECGPTSTAVITSENTVYTFGENKFGQLGQGDKADVMIPKLLSPPDSTPLHQDEILHVAVGAQMSAIIDTNGYLYTMGYNGNVMKDGIGCLGHGYFPEEYLTVPTLVQSLVEDGCEAKQVVVGKSHMTVLTKEGEVLVSGSGVHGRCGNIDPDDQLFLEPVELLASETDICQIAGGDEFSLALKEDGVVFAWGRNEKGQCGSGISMGVEQFAMEPMPVEVQGMLEGRKVVKIEAGRAHAAAVTENGELFVWGSRQESLPGLVPQLGHTKIVDVACGNDYTIALDEEGKIYSFGSGKTGVLGLASEKNTTFPLLVEGMLGKKVVKISAGWSHVACLAEESEN